MLASFLKSVKEEFNLMKKGKMIFIVIIIIPIFTNLLLGYEFNKDQIQNISMAIYDQDNTSLSRMIVSSFMENEMFDVKYYPTDSGQMEDLFNSNKVRVGMIIPKDFNKAVLETKSPTILMIYDGSHMPITGAAKSRASEILLTLKTGTLIKTLEGKLNLPADVAENMALAVKFKNRILYNPAKSYKNFLNIGMGTAIVQSAVALMTAVSIKRDKLPKEKSKRLGYFIGKVSFYSILGWISLMINIAFIQIKLFNIPFRGEILDVAILSLVLSLAVSSFGTMISTWIKDEMIATIINAVIFVPNTIMVGYTWPTISMPTPYKMIAEFYPFYHYADNLRDIFLKGLPYIKVKGDILWLIGFSLITIALSLFRLLLLKVDNEGVKDEKEGEIVALP